MDEGVTSRWRPILGWLLGIGFLGALLYLLQVTVGWRELFQPWKALGPARVAGAFFLVLGSYALRTVRVHQYFRPDTAGSFLPTFRLVLLHNLLNNLLPMRSGEASFPVLMKQSFQVPLLRSVSGLLYLRVLDLHFLLVLSALVFFGRWGPAGWAVPLLLLPLPLLAFRFHEAARRGHPDGEGGLARLLEALPSSPGLFWSVWLWTGLNWTVKLLVFAWILGAFHPMPYTTALLGSVTGELSSVLPVHGVAGAGTYEAGVLASLLPLGIELEPALRAAVNLHLFVLGASVLSGALGLLLPSGPSRREASSV